MNIERYEFPGWDRCMRCLCHTQDVCPDLEHLYALEEDREWWKNLSETEKFKIESENAAWAVGRMLNSLYVSEVDF